VGVDARRRQQETRGTATKLSTLTAAPAAGAALVLLLLADLDRGQFPSGLLASSLVNILLTVLARSRSSIHA